MVAAVSIATPSVLRDGSLPATPIAELLKLCPQVFVLGATVAPPLAGEPWQVRILFAQPTATVVGLPGWRDAADGVCTVADQTVLWSAFEVERAIRHLLRQSTELLALVASAPAHLPPGSVPNGQLATPWMDELMALAAGAITTEAVASLLATARFQLADGSPCRQIGAYTLATAYHLALDGILCWDGDELRRWWAVSTIAPWSLDEPPPLCNLQALLDVSTSTGVLPGIPPAYDQLHDYLVRLRRRFFADGPTTTGT